MQKCSCGHIGAIAEHLRANQHCLQGIREEMAPGVEMLDEVLIVQATLVLKGCPAFGCPGGDHEEIPEICIVWWKEKGWDFMQWDQSTENLNSLLINQKCAEYVNSLTEEFDDQEQQGTQKNTEVSYIKKKELCSNVMTLIAIITL